MTQQSSPPSVSGAERWQNMARRLRVPLGFVTAAFFIFEAARSPLHPAALAWSLVLVLPGLALRAVASGTVKKNRELTVSGPYAYTRNPLYLGSMLMAAGFAVALLSWPLALVLAAGFAIIYIPVIAGEEKFLRATFPDFDDYCLRVPRLIPRLRRARVQNRQDVALYGSSAANPASGGFSFALYIQHREYNAAIGAALLYLSLLFLRPALGFVLRGFN